ncbi:alpha/beta-hydrolase [Exidia glandulosa HHB12029]|uniref:Alpha/beta-hydrolase n=1 Tax=Exidia glandulosa HHB12029 TaxID=1314781 RepID=A0A165EXZ2_EXIGL|nr:alpha/beta-hydrolase [Exidia glandulosa HHB12029]
MRQISTAVVLSTFAGLVAGSLLDPDFDPSAYPQRVANCESEGHSLDIHYVDINPDGHRNLVLVHGWPGLWSTWANQISYLSKDPQYHIIVPDLRGFGSSTHPGSASFHEMADDLVCVLYDAGETSAILIGHDWGSQVSYEALRSFPDVFQGASGTIPYIPSVGDFVPIEHIAKQLDHLTYQIYFERETKAAASELAADVRRSLRSVYQDVAHPPPKAFLTSSTDFLKAYDGEPLDQRIPFLNEKEEDYLVQAYERSGFLNTLQFYTHPFRFGSHEYASKEGRKIIDEPTALIYPDADPVVEDWAAAMELLHTRSFVTNLTLFKVHAAHWPQLENPVAFNEALRQWLDTFPPIEYEEDEHDEHEHGHEGSDDEDQLVAPIADEPLLEPLLHEDL